MNGGDVHEQIPNIQCPVKSKGDIRAKHVIKSLAAVRFTAHIQKDPTSHVAVSKIHHPKIMLSVTCSTSLGFPTLSQRKFSSLLMMHSSLCQKRSGNEWSWMEWAGIIPGSKWYTESYILCLTVSALQRQNSWWSWCSKYEALFLRPWYTAVGCKCWTEKNMAHTKGRLSYHEVVKSFTGVIHNRKPHNRIS